MLDLLDPKERAKLLALPELPAGVECANPSEERWAREHLRFLQENNPVFLEEMRREGSLNNYLSSMKRRNRPSPRTERGRKKLQEDTAHKKTARAKILKLADKTSNLRALVSSPAPDWSVRRRIEYIAWARKVAAGLRGANASLEKQFDDAARAAEQSIVPSP